jgi:hypothetical protein
MMKTEDLIETLAADLRPVPPFALQLRLLKAALVGAACTGAIVILWGLRDDLVAALGQWDLWRKLAFTVAVAVLGLAAVFQASRPDVRVTGRAWMMIVPFVIIACLGFTELAMLDSIERRATWLGQTALICPWSILLLSVPVLIALMIGMRRLAPTRPAIAGFAAGVASGAIAATLYGLHCPEWAASFVATWYALGIFASGMLGAVVGWRLLRW